MKMASFFMNYVFRSLGVHRKNYLTASLIDSTKTDIAVTELFDGDLNGLSLCKRFTVFKGEPPVHRAHHENENKRGETTGLLRNECNDVNSFHTGTHRHWTTYKMDSRQNHKIIDIATLILR